VVDSVEIVAVDSENLASRGFFCRKSRMKTSGNRRKLEWAESGFEQGLGIEILYDGGRSVGFVEYVPGEHAWRVVNAPDFMVIHCIWVVGRAKGKGYGSALLERAETAARAAGYGYTVVDEAPPAFELMAKVFDESAPSPSFPTNWEERAEAFGPGLTVVTTNQCPYLDDAEQQIMTGAEQMGISARIVNFESATEVQQRSPAPFGVFGVVLDGELLAYHYLLEKDLTQLVGGRR